MRGSEVDVELLGGAMVRRAGAPVAALLAQPKRLALLAFLLLRRGGAPVRRDEVLAIFWPEAPEVRARASLRQAVRFLRLQLGADVLAGHGEGEPAARVHRGALRAGIGRG